MIDSLCALCSCAIIRSGEDVIFLKKVSKRECDALMRNILALDRTGRTVDLTADRDFFRDVQENERIYKTLKYLEAKGHISCSHNPVSHKLLQIRVTDSGVTYFEDNAEITRKERIEWIRYIITTAIAVVALITAITSIILQYR